MFVCTAKESTSKATKLSSLQVGPKNYIKKVRTLFEQTSYIILNMCRYWWPWVCHGRRPLGVRSLRRLKNSAEHFLYAHDGLCVPHLEVYPATTSQGCRFFNPRAFALLLGHLGLSVTCKFTRILEFLSLPNKSEP